MLALTATFGWGQDLAQPGGGSPPAAGGALNSQQIRRLLDSASLKAQADEERATNGRIVGSIPTPVVSGVGQGAGEPDRRFPQLSAAQAAVASVYKRFGEVAYQSVQGVRFGHHNVVSSDGEAAVELMRESVSGGVERQRAAWDRLRLLAGQGQPEATNFVGYVVDLGLFGQRPDAVLAARYYRAAAARGYQPAIYNLALQAAYGRAGPQDLGLAVRLIQRAAVIGPDDSFRICGMGSYLELRDGREREALALSNNCPSALASLARARGATAPVDARLVEAIRKSIGAGADDGYAALEEIGRVNVASDRQLLYCKYRLMDEFRGRANLEGLQEAAQQCAEKIRPLMPRDLARSIPPAQLASSFVGFVMSERAAIAAMRAGDHYHYGRSVPFLPFGAAEVDLFEPTVSAAIAARARANTTAQAR